MKIGDQFTCQLEITAFIRKKIGTTKIEDLIGGQSVYFDDADLVIGSDTVIPELLIRTLEFTTDEVLVIVRRHMTSIGIDKLYYK